MDGEPLSARGKHDAVDDGRNIETVAADGEDVANSHG
jgi:hypothetical protein